MVDNTSISQFTLTVTGQDLLGTAVPSDSDPAGTNLLPLATIGNFVWRDSDRDGVQDSGEPGIAGVTVLVFSVDGSGNTVGDPIEAITNGSGAWTLDVLPGDYRVSVTLPANGSFTLQNTGADDVDSDVATTGASAGFTGVYSVASGESDLTIDAGVVFPVVNATLGNFVWFDRDRDGTQDSGEPGEAGVVVQIREGATVVATATTGSDGFWQVNLPPGTYTVTVVSPAGTAFTGQNAGADDVDSDVNAVGVSAAITLGEGEVNLTVDAGVVENPVIGLAKDLTSGPTRNANGDWAMTFTYVIENVGSTALTNVQLTDNFAAVFSPGTVVSGPTPAASGCSATAAAGTATLAVGASCTAVWSVVIRGLVPGTTYNNTATVAGTSPRGVVVTDISDDGAETDTDGDGNPNESTENDPTPVLIPENPVIGLAKDLTAGPTANANGDWAMTFTYVIENVGDVALTNVRLTDNFAAVFAPGTVVSGPTPAAGGCSATAAAGTATLAVGASCTAVWSVVIRGLVPGTTYNNTATAAGTSPLGRVVTDISDDGAEVDPDGDGVPNEPGENDPTPVVIPAPAKATLGNKVFIDIDNDGIQDAGEAPLAGVVVQVTRQGSSTPVEVDTTDANGLWSVLVDPGTYTVTFVKPTGYTFSPQGQGTNPAVDSNPAANGTTAAVTLVAGDVNETVDAGVVPLGSLGKTVFLDANGNGSQDAGETVVPGVTVRLFRANADGTKGAQVATTVTDSAGDYNFNDLEPGDYIVVLAPPAGFGLTVTNVGDDTSDSDFSQLTGESGVIRILPGQRVDTVDAGLVRIVVVPPFTPTTPSLPFPGPFTTPETTPPAPPLALPTPPAPPLALTGSASNVLVTMAIAMLGVGGTMFTGARRQRRQ